MPFGTLLLTIIVVAVGSFLVYAAFLLIRLVAFVTDRILDAAQLRGALAVQVARDVEANRP